MNYVIIRDVLMLLKHSSEKIKGMASSDALCLAIPGVCVEEVPLSAVERRGYRICC